MNNSRIYQRTNSHRPPTGHSGFRPFSQDQATGYNPQLRVGHDHQHKMMKSNARRLCRLRLVLLVRAVNQIIIKLTTVAFPEHDWLRKNCTNMASTGQKLSGYHPHPPNFAMARCRNCRTHAGQYSADAKARNEKELCSGFELAFPRTHEPSTDRFYQVSSFDDMLAQLFWLTFRIYKEEKIESFNNSFV